MNAGEARNERGSRWLISGVLLVSALAWLGLAVSGGGLLSTTPRQTAVPVELENVSGLSYDGEGLWVTVEGARKIYRVDPDSGAIGREIVLPVARTGGSAWDGEHLWQIAWEDKEIYRLDLASGRVIETFATPGEGICAGMTFDGSHLWLSNVEDEKLYRIDRERGEVVQVVEGDFETTGLAWDGEHLWNGVLVGSGDHDAETPYTGFVQERDLQSARTLRVLPVHGVFAGSSDWMPGGGRAERLWWFDGYHQQLVQFDLRQRYRHVWRWLGLGLLAIHLVAVAAWWTPRAGTQEGRG